MKRNLLSLLLILLSITSQSQSIIDSCFQSCNVSISFSGSTTLANSTDADLVQWDGTQWQGSWGSANVNLPAPCDKINARAIWMGDQDLWTSGGEGFSAKLDVALVSGTTYYFTFTYASDGSFSYGNFSPYFKTNSSSDYFSAYSVGQLDPVGYDWETHTFSFTATSSQNGHNWILIHSNHGSGMVLSSCDSSLGVHLPADTSLCSGDTMLLDAGSGFDAYSWNTGDTTSSISITSAGIYYVEVTSGSCTKADSINISNTNCGPQTIFTSSTTSLCEKFCLDFFDQSLDDPDTWQWLFPGGSPASSTDQNPASICYTEPGIYDVTLITSNAGGSDTLILEDYITVFPTPPFPTITQAGYTLTSSLADSYQWQLNATDIPGATNQSYDALQTGFYTVIVSDSNGCKNSATQYVEITGIHELSDANIYVYPNPSNGNFVIDLQELQNSKEVLIEVVNAIGQKVFSSEEKSLPDGSQVSPSDHQKEIQLNKPAVGVYFIEISSEDSFAIKKIIIEN